MAAPDTHPLTLLSLVAKNYRAEQILAHPDNKHLVSSTADGQLSINLGLPIRGSTSTTIATFGRGKYVDIYVSGAGISRLQCTFELDFHSGIVMFYDRSHARTSQVFGENATPFEPGRVRKVVVMSGLNTVVGMGGDRCNLILFELIWPITSGDETVNIIRQYGSLPNAQRQNLRAALTQPHTPVQNVLRMRHVKLGCLGRGTFGKVHKAIDVDSGKLMAVKVLRLPQNGSDDQKRSLRRGIEILLPNIVDYIASQGWFDGDTEIFMGLKEVSLKSLIQQGAGATAAARLAFRDMLRALDFMAQNNIIPREVKPENILYTLWPSGEYQFQLADFGLSNYTINGATYSSSPKFMAPEVARGEHPSCKVDVWSLFVTILWTLNVNGFREAEFTTIQEIQTAVALARSDWRMSPVAEVAIENPLQRASAAQMLAKFFSSEEPNPLFSQTPASDVNSTPEDVPVTDSHTL